MLRNCQVCNKEFVTFPSRIKIGKGKYCRECRPRFPKGHVPWSKGRTGVHYSPTTEFKKGQVSWNKGRKAPWAKHNKQFKKGMTPWNKGLKGFCGGEKHWNWKGGLRDTRRKLHETYEYRKWKKAVMDRDNHTCQICGSTKNIEVDHIKRWKEHPELRHDMANGRALCRPCHMKTPTYGNYRHGRYVKKTVQMVLV